MFGKLLKYDFRSMLKQFAFIWPAALALAVINRFTLSGLESTSATGETVAAVASQYDCHVCHHLDFCDPAVL